MSSVANVFFQSFFHGTRADLKPGDLIVVGYQSNFTDVKPLSWIYFAATLDAAIWGAELAVGSGRERIYVVEPTGPIMDDPNLTDKKFPGNPTLSYRSRDPLQSHSRSYELARALARTATANEGERCPREGGGYRYHRLNCGYQDVKPA